MKRIRLWPTTCLLFGAVCAAIFGCGGTDDANRAGDGGGRAGGVARISAEDLRHCIGHYMPPLEGGALKIAAPSGWVWSRAGSDYLVGFHKEGSSLNNLPRILVTAEDSPSPGLSDVDEENVGQLVTLVLQSVDASKLKGTVEPIILGNTACARYVDLAKRKNALVARQTLETIARGRLYTIRLEAYDREFTKYRDMGYAVAASMEFGSPETTETAPESTQTAPGAADDTEATDSGAASPPVDADGSPEAADATSE